MHDPWWWRAILGGVAAIGFGWGWNIVDHWLEKRKARREAKMRNVTPQ